MENQRATGRMCRGDGHRRRSFGFTLVALALSSLVISRSAMAGPIILAGHDPDDHGFTTQYTSLFNAIFANVTNGGSGILAIGADPSTSAGNWITTVAGLMSTPQTVTFVNNAAISSVSFAGYAIIHVPSTTVDTPGGINATTENPLLTARSNDIATFVNGGGGLFGLTQDQVADAYDYLGPFANINAMGVPASGNCGGSQLYDDVTATPLGTSLGITNTNIDGCCWHNVFTSYASFLQVLATANEPNCTNPVINTQASVIGCLQCSVPGQMNLTPPLDLNPPGASHTVTTTLVQGFPPHNPLPNVVVTFTVISGPNAGVTGMATTNVNGQATFAYVGSGGIGLDVIRATATDPQTMAMITSNDALKFWDEDCNANNIPDTCDISCSAYSSACMANYPACGGSDDVNTNDVPDECDDCIVNANCTDGLFCNGSEICNNGQCEPGVPPSCNDSIACTTDTCNEATDQCDHTPDNGACSNGQFCDGSEICNALTGCQAGTPPNCDDSIACTVDACNEAADQCDHTPDNGACSNGLSCDGFEICDVSTGCQAGTPPNCADSVACTVDVCNEATDSCDHTANNGACDDDLFCDGSETCNPLSGCQAGTPVDCADAFACTTDNCNESTNQCTHTANNPQCSNGLGCDGPEICNPALGCQPGTPPCGNGDACTQVQCVEPGQCIETPLCCGNGVIDDEEECDPPTVMDEICDNLMDDDNDTLIDCLDPECANEPCLADCTEFMCKLIEKDPAVILVNETDAPLGSVKIHGRVRIDMASFSIDFTETGFGFLLLNANGPIFSDTIDPGFFVRKGFGRYRFKDKNAANTGGLSKVSTKLRLIEGVPYLSFALRGYGDMRAATLAEMTTMVYGVDDVGALTATWKRGLRGWSLKPSDYPVSP